MPLLLGSASFLTTLTKSIRIALFSLLISTDAISDIISVSVMAMVRWARKLLISSS